MQQNNRKFSDTTETRYNYIARKEGLIRKDACNSVSVGSRHVAYGTKYKNHMKDESSFSLSFNIVDMKSLIKQLLCNLTTLELAFPYLKKNRSKRLVKV